MNAEPLMPSWVWDVIVLCLVVVPFLVVYVWALIERVRAIRHKRRQERELEEDALDLRMAFGLTIANRDGLLEERPRPPEDIQ